MTEFLQKRKEVKSSSFTRVWATHQGSGTLTPGHPALLSLSEQCCSFLCVEKGAKYQSAPFTSTALLKGTPVPTVQAGEHPEHVFKSLIKVTQGLPITVWPICWEVVRPPKLNLDRDYVIKPMRFSFSLLLSLPLSLSPTPYLSPFGNDWEIQGRWSLSCQWEQKLKICIRRTHAM